MTTKLGRTRTRKGILYFPSYDAARQYAESINAPTDRIIEYEIGWAIQMHVSGPYVGPMGRTRQAKARKARKVRVRCDQCEMLSINGVACHETGCPNSGATWSEYRQEWVHYCKCRECGCDVERGEYCNCNNPEE